jgi:hypothetical protein
MIREPVRKLVEAEINTTVGRIDLGFCVLLTGLLATSGINIEIGQDILFSLEVSAPPFTHFTMLILLVVTSLIITGFYLPENNQSGRVNQRIDNSYSNDTENTEEASNDQPSSDHLKDVIEKYGYDDSSEEYEHQK